MAIHVNFYKDEGIFIINCSPLRRCLRLSLALLHDILLVRIGEVNTIQLQNGEEGLLRNETFLVYSLRKGDLR